jgi:Histidine kinase-, DNA gyrase B-, and HSP90-like ATPase
LAASIRSGGNFGCCPPHPPQTASDGRAKWPSRVRGALLPSRTGCWRFPDASRWIRSRSIPTSELLHRTLGETIALETVLSSGVWRIHADANQLENSLLNLALNARDAMPGGGKMTIETANCFLDESYVSVLSEPVEPGQFVMIAVADTGSGMSKETLDHAFEPFFTTKDIGKGTGLGLSQAYGFVRQSSGHIRIYSEPGQGTTVKLYLPRHLGEVPVVGAERQRLSPRALGKERILVVEDDAALRAFTVEVL